MPVDLILPTSIALALLSYGLIAKWHVMPWLESQPREEALQSLLWLHAFRFIGLAFLIPGVTAEVLDPRFANPAAYGDLLAAILALIAIIGLRQRWRLAILLVWIFNIEGTLDLLNAVAQGFRYTEDGSLGATFFIPALIVPALLVSHAVIFILLLRRDTPPDNRLDQLS